MRSRQLRRDRPVAVEVPEPVEAAGEPGTGVLGHVVVEVVGTEPVGERVDHGEAVEQVAGLAGAPGGR